MTLLPVLLPEGYALKVSVNDKLTAGQIIAEKKEKGAEEIIHLSRSFNIPPKNIVKTLRKSLGDSISIGDVIAIKKGKLGFGSKKIISNFSGTIAKIDEEKGEVCIRTAGEGKTESIFSPVDGIVDFCNNEKIVIKTDKETIIAQDASGKEKAGELLYIEHFDQNKLTKDVESKVILTKEIDRLSLFKAIGLDASGLVAREISDMDFVDLSEKAIETPVMIISEEDFKKLIKADGKKVFLNGGDKSIVVL